MGPARGFRKAPAPPELDAFVRPQGAGRGAALRELHAVFLAERTVRAASEVRTQRSSSVQQQRQACCPERTMNPQILIDNVVRQTTVLTAVTTRNATRSRQGTPVRRVCVVG